MAGPTLCISTDIPVTGACGLTSHPVNPDMPFRNKRSGEASETQDSRLNMERGGQATPPASHATASTINEAANFDHVKNDQECHDDATPDLPMTAGEDTEFSSALEMAYHNPQEPRDRTSGASIWAGERSQRSWGRCCKCGATGRLMSWPHCQSCFHRQCQWCEHSEGSASNMEDDLTLDQRVNRLNELSGEIGLELEALSDDGALLPRQWLVVGVWDSLIQLNTRLTELEAQLPNLARSREDFSMGGDEDGNHKARAKPTEMVLGTLMRANGEKSI